LHTPTDIKTSWPDAIYGHFSRVGVRQVGYVPDAGHSRLIQLCQADNSIADVVLTTEEEGVGLVAGAALGGQRAALLMQSSGVGNCINMFSLLRNCGFGCVVLVTMRGEFGEFNPWQVPMGAITEDVLKLQPTALREAGMALGTPHWSAIRQILWKSAGSGILTGGLLAFARISGETAPLLFTSLNEQFLNFNLTKEMASLPVVIFNDALSAYDDLVRLAWAGALIIAVAVLGTNVLARIITRERHPS